MNIRISWQRLAFAIVVGLQLALAEAISTNTFPQWTAYLTLIGTAIGGVLQLLNITPQVAARISTRPPPLPLLVLLGGLALAPFADACKSPSSQDVKTGIDVTDTACTLVQAVLGNDVVKTICATVDEIDQLVGDVMKDQAAHRAEGIPCHTVQGSQRACATDQQISDWIDRTNAVRRARLLRDAGPQ